MTVRTRSRTGEYVECSLSGEKCRAFVPTRLPPDPPIDLGPLYGAIDAATQSLARLDGQSSLLPDLNLFLYMYVRKEAVLSAQIEGTQSSLSELLLFEQEEFMPNDDLVEISNYVAAMSFCLKKIRDPDGLPLCSRLIRCAHERLLRSGRGTTKAPGEFRQSPVWIGGSAPSNATFVPPPHERVEDLMTDLERFIHDDSVQIPLLVRAAIAHVQFETIHPFLDGNGRVGRLLMTLMLCDKGALREPLFYPSLYFKTYRAEYYERLVRVRTHGEWEQWIDFFLRGVSDTARQASHAATEILQLFEQDKQLIESLGASASSVRRVHQHLQQWPLLSVPKAQIELGLSAPTIRRAIDRLEKLGIIHETTGKQRHRRYLYTAFVRILEEGAEPIAH